MKNLIVFASSKTGKERNNCTSLVHLVRPLQKIIRTHKIEEVDCPRSKRARVPRGFRYRNGGGAIPNQPRWRET